MLKKTVALVGVLLTAQLIYAKNIEKNNIPYCKADQIKIHELAVDYPGMMHSNSLYGVINTSNTRCVLGRRIQAWVTQKDGTRDNMTSASPWLNTKKQRLTVLEPTSNKNHIAANKLTWFSFSAAGDISLSNKVKVKLAGLNKTFPINYSAYTHGINFGDSYEKGKFIQNDGWLKKGGLERWPMLSSVGDEDCSYNTKNFKPVWDKKKLDSLEIHFDKVARCG